MTTTMSEEEETATTHGKCPNGHGDEDGIIAAEESFDAHSYPNCPICGCKLEMENMDKFETKKHESEVSFWDIKVYEGRDEQETIRGLNSVQKDTMLAVFNRIGVKATAIGYNSNESYVEGKTQTVNSHVGTIHD